MEDAIRRARILATVSDEPFFCFVCQTFQHFASTPHVCEDCGPFVVKLWKRECRLAKNAEPKQRDFAIDLVRRLQLEDDR